MPTTDALLQQAIDAITAARAQLVPPVVVVPPPASSAVIVVRKADNLASVLETAPAGAILALDVDVRMDRSYTFSKPVSVIGPLMPMTRMDETSPLPILNGEFKVSAPDVTLATVELRNPSVDQAILSLAGSNTTLDRVRVLGDPVKGQRRGVAGNAANVTLRRCYVEDCFHSEDAQAFCAWDGPGPFLIDDCYLSGSGQAVMFGGADPSSKDRIPTDIRILNSTLTKRLAWKDHFGVTVKNALELKNARRVQIVGNIIERSWKDGQNGYLIMLTPRNQGFRPERALWTTIEDVTISKNTIRQGSAALCVLGRDDHSLASTLKRVTFTENTISEIDPVAWGGGDTRLMLVLDGPEDLQITKNSCSGQNVRTTVQLTGATPAKNLVITGNSFPATKYHIIGERDLSTMVSGASLLALNTWPAA